MLGIFDSGLGGLTVAKAIRQHLPQYQLLYLGDTARLPYGNRSVDAVYHFTAQAVGYLLEHGCPLVVVACNTASAVALRRLQQEWLPKHFPSARVLGVIRPLAEHVATVSRFGRIGVVGTRATVESNAYVREIAAQNPQATVTQAACPLLVPLIEEGFGRRPETKKILRQYVNPLKRARVDTLVLGCTHYPLLLREFLAVMGTSCRVPDPSTVVADKLADYLACHPEIEKRIARGNAHRFLVTDRTARFAQLASNWMGGTVNLESVQLDGSRG